MSNKLQDGDTFEYEGRLFRVKYVHDDTSGPPWENEYGHGPVRTSMKRHGNYGHDKRPGERPLNFPGWNEYQYYYDWQAACKLARKDGWNTEPFDAPNRIQRAVQADFEFIRLWLNNDWEYVGVVCELVEDDDGELKVIDSESLWGVETYKDYHMEVAYELADQLLIDIERRTFPVSTMGV